MLFNLYLLFVICFLMIVCYFVSFDIITATFDIFVIYNTISLDKYQSIEHHEILSVARSYILRKKWLSCLLMLEFVLNKEKNDINLQEYYNCLAFCFYTLKIYDKAKKYYLDAIKISSDNIIALRGLIDIYEISNDSNKVIEIYQKILSIEPNNNKARAYINKFS